MQENTRFWALQLADMDQRLAVQTQVRLSVAVLNGYSTGTHSADAALAGMAVKRHSTHRVDALRATYCTSVDAPMQRTPDASCASIV